MNVKTLLPSNSDGKMRGLWERLITTFGYEHATISEADLLAQPVRLGVTKKTVSSVIKWSKEENFLATADERGQVRLTPHGHRVWSEVNGEA